MSAGRRRWVAAAGRGRGGGIARGACCGSVPAPVAVAVVRQSKSWRREESGDARKQIEIATSRLWVRVERVDVSHVGVLTDPNRSPLKPSRKSSPFASLPREGEC